MLWLCSVAKNILPGFFFTFEASTGLISHLCRLRTSCQRADSARSLSPSNFALAPFLPWKLRLCLHTPSLDSAATHHFCGYVTWDGTDGASRRLMCVAGLIHRFLLRILGRLPAINTHSSTHIKIWSLYCCHSTAIKTNTVTLATFVSLKYLHLPDCKFSSVPSHFIASDN